MELSPSVYEHAAALLGRTPWEVSRDAELLFAAHAEACRVYRHTPIMPGIDIYNLEAEAYGATVINPGGIGIPAITRPICRSTGDLLQLAPLPPRTAGRIPMAVRVAGRPNVCLGTGALPYETPPENVIRLRDYAAGR